MKNSKFNKSNRYIKSTGILIILVIFVFSIMSYIYKPKARAQVFITSGSSWVVPGDWSNTNNTIEVIGGGGGGGGGSGAFDGGGGAGGGGSYAKVLNATLTPGATVTISIGSAGTAGAIDGTGGTGGDTYLCNAAVNCTSITDSAVIVGAKGGTGGVFGTNQGGAGGAGGNAANNVGTTNYSGGTGGAGGPGGGPQGGGGGGAGGAAGKNAAGNNGTTATSTTGAAGGQGDGSFGGAGGTSNGAVGSNGTEYDASHGSGGGGAGGQGVGNVNGLPGGAGGNYGGGGGGGGGSKKAVGGVGATGIQGLIRVSYTYTSQESYRWRLDDGNETSGSSLAAENSAATINYGTPVRLRIALTNLGDTTTFSYRLEYASYTDSCGSWTPIPVTPTTEHFNIYASTNITDQAATANVSSGPGVITDPSGYTFSGGKFVRPPSNTATSQTLLANQFTEMEFALTANSNASYPSYCFRLTTSAGTTLESYSRYPILNINYPPGTPTIHSVINSSVNVPRMPIFQLRSYDYNADYLKYVVEVCPANSWPCASGAQTYSESNSCWQGQDAQSNTAYSANSLIELSAMAYCSSPYANMLTPNTTYYMRAKAIDPGGSNIYSAYSSVASFTTAALDILINGNTSITGNTMIGN